MSAAPALERRRRLSFLPLAPLAVIALGVATAVVVAWVGLGQLDEQSHAAAQHRAELLSAALAARLQATEPEAKPAVIARAAERSGLSVALLDEGGGVVHQSGDARFDAAEDWVLAPSGSGKLAVHAELGSVRPDPSSLFASVAALTWILVGAAALVAFAIARDVRSDVAYVERRITEMAREDREPAGKLIPARTIDQVGRLTVAFNGLVERFTAAERAYRQDLAGALAYDRDRSAFLAALSHELRTPLNAILGFADVLLAEVDGPLGADARENLEVVRSSGQHLRELIDDILELSALESGELELSPQAVDLWSVAEDVVREARINAQDKPLEVVLDGEPLEIWGDARRIRQILANVVGNAVKFTREGKVTVSLEAQSERWAKVSVRDTGPGIAPEDQASIFDEYRQAGDVATRRAGSGLGLAITRRLLQMHDGSIDLESSLGEGSVFRIFLPRQAPAPKAEEAQA
ncbi:MAG: HAMP domain-containing histidine kinase [Myxococcales bacterium]|nr:HAMP domain-containing histidine kinase [Myxococcales bacterium]